MVSYYAVRAKDAERLTYARLARWRDSLPSPSELDEMVMNLTDQLFYRKTRR